MNERVILAFDFGGTKLTAVSLLESDLTAVSPQFHRLERQYTAPTSTATDEIAQMIEMGRLVADGRPIARIGVSFGGPVDYSAGIVRHSPHVRGWEAVPLQAILADAFQTSVRIDNDGNVAALGEWAFGAGRGVEHLLYVTVSTGVGGGWILHKRPFRGQHNMAGEIGHMVIDPSGPTCVCGKNGCLERLASGVFMAQDFADQMGWPRNEVDGKRLFALAESGEETAVTIINRGATALGIALGNAANLIAPQRIVIGGGVSKAGALWWQTVQQMARQTALPEIMLDIAPARFQDDAPLWGGVVLT